MRRLLAVFLYRLLAHAALLLALLSLPLLALFRFDLAAWLLRRAFPPRLKRCTTWFHGVSVGELRLIRHLLHGMSPNQLAGLCITTTTPNGWRLLQKMPGPFQRQLLPLDLPWSMGRFIGRQNPHLLVAETELWFELFSAVHRRGGRIILFNARLSSSSFPFPLAALTRSCLGQVESVFARGETDRRNLVALGLPADRVSVVGNLKMAPPDEATTQPLPADLAFWCNKWAGFLCLASVADDEIDILLPVLTAIRQRQPDLAILYAPRQVQHASRHQQALAALQPCLRSLAPQPESRILLLDSLGELAATFPLAGMVVVCGSFGRRGGQNFLESLHAETLTVVGPHLRHFQQELEEARSAEAILQLNSALELPDLVDAWQTNPSAFDPQRASARAWIQQKRGGLERMRHRLVDLNLLPPQDAEPKVNP
jgi:3-deoxy-D-manno-octulosonic-acid transferase